jgi:hypothetical protein
MLINYCTLFDINYLKQGLALYESLNKLNEKFILHVLCLDDLTFAVLNNLNLNNLIISQISDIPNIDFDSLKKTRTKGEFAWTCTPIYTDYCLNNFNLDNIVYVDADLYFFNSPIDTFNELEKNNKSVLITEHNYSDNLLLISKTGIFCVQYLIFKNTIEAKSLLVKWKEQCIDWCYNRIEDGKFGDQKYLDEWIDLNFVCVSKNLNLGIAPWNFNNSNINYNKIIFFHFHTFNFVANNKIILLKGYNLSYTNYIKIYKVYLNHINLINKILKEKQLKIPSPTTKAPSYIMSYLYILSTNIKIVYRKILHNSTEKFKFHKVFYIIKSE